MDKQDKELLLKDLCARMPYRLIINCTLFDKSIIGRIYLLHYDAGLCYIEIDKYPDNWDLYQDFNPCVDFEFVKPYLRPMSSMTEKERFEYLDFLKSEIQDGGYVTENHVVSLAYMPILIDWLNSHHLDYRGLIKKGLALPAPDGMYDF